MRPAVRLFNFNEGNFAADSVEGVEVKKPATSDVRDQGSGKAFEQIGTIP